MFHRIPPVGNPISWRHPAPPPSLTANSEQCLFFQSGTAALAQALIVAKSVSQTETPEVIVPAYACPDIVSASVYAGITPVLVDLEPDSPYMSLSAIEKATTSNTVAVIAINFLGIPERVAAIRSSLGNKQIFVIEDSAQWYPDSEGDIPISNLYQGDLVILSFGKGKPLSLMGGGALLIKTPKLAESLEQELFLRDKNTQPKTDLKTKLLFSAYNIAISTYGYWLLELLPWIKLGETHYKKLEEIGTIDSNRLSLMSSNQQRYQERLKTAQNTMANILSNGQQNVIDLPKQCETFKNQRLLRYPILMRSSKARDKALSLMGRNGSGASPLYPTILSNIEGAKNHAKQSLPLGNAIDFASRLITLPTHDEVNGQHIASIQKALQLND